MVHVIFIILLPRFYCNSNCNNLYYYFTQPGVNRNVKITYLENCGSNPT